MPEPMGDTCHSGCHTSLDFMYSYVYSKGTQILQMFRGPMLSGFGRENEDPATYNSGALNSGLRVCVREQRLASQLSCSEPLGLSP